MGRDFSLRYHAQGCPGVHPYPIQWIGEALTSEVKQLESETDESSESGAEVKNA